MQVSQNTGEVVWYYHLFKNFPQSVVTQFVVIHTVRGFSVVSEANVDDFLAIRCLSFLIPACTSGSSWFTYCGSLA